MGNISTTTFICQLPKPMQETVYQDIMSFYHSEGIDPFDKDDFGNTNIEVAMGGRLCDLEENIDISVYFK